jgi:CheY-like chemotaxis protein
VSRRPILLAEDDPRKAQLTLGALEEYNLTNQIFVVQDGEEVLDYLYCRGRFAAREGDNPITVLLNLKMPKIDGLEALKIIKTDQYLKTIPVVILTSSRETADVAQCYQHGANACVVKPMDFGEFAKVVKQLGCFWGTINEPPPDTKRLKTSKPG